MLLCFLLIIVLNSLLSNLVCLKNRKTENKWKLTDYKKGGKLKLPLSSLSSNDKKEIFSVPVYYKYKNFKSSEKVRNTDYNGWKIAIEEKNIPEELKQYKTFNLQYIKYLEKKGDEKSKIIKFYLPFYLLTEVNFYDEKIDLRYNNNNLELILSTIDGKSDLEPVKQFFEKLDDSDFKISNLTGLSIDDIIIKYQSRKLFINKNWKVISDNPFNGNNSELFSLDENRKLSFINISGLDNIACIVDNKSQKSISFYKGNDYIELIVEEATITEIFNKIKDLNHKTVIKMGSCK